MRKVLTILLIFSLLAPAAGAFQKSQEKEKKPKSIFGGIIPGKKSGDDQQGKSGDKGQKGTFSDQVKQQEQESAPLLPGKNLDVEIDASLAAAAQSRELDEQREYSALYSRAEVEQYKQKLQPNANELDSLRQRHEALLKELGLRELMNEEKANIEDKENGWQSVDMRMADVYNNAIFLSKMSPLPPPSPFKSVAEMIAVTYQSRTVAAPATPAAPAATPAFSASPGGSAFVFNAHQEGLTSYMNLASLPVTNTLPEQFKMKPLPDLPVPPPVVASRPSKEKAADKTPSDAPAPSKKNSKTMEQRKLQSAQSAGPARRPQAAQAPKTANAAGPAAAKGKAPVKGKAAGPARPGAAKTASANKQSAETATAETEAGRATTSATDSTRAISPSPDVAAAPGAETSAPAAAAAPATSVAPAPAPVAEEVTAVKSPNVQFAEQPAAKPASPANASVNADAKPASPAAGATSGKDKKDKKGSKENNGGGAGSFMKGMGGAFKKKIDSKIDPKGAEEKEMKAALARSLSKIDAEDEFFFSNRMQYNRLHEQFDQAPLLGDKERIRKEMSALLEKEQKLESLYREIKLKQDQLNLRQNAINIAEDSAHFTAGKYASGVKNILITRANWVVVKKYSIPKSQWYDLYLNRFVCQKGEDCKANYEKMAQENFAAVEKSEQAKDPNAKTDPKDPNAKSAEQAGDLKPKTGDDPRPVILPRADETLRHPNKCEKQPFAFEKSDGNCWVLQEVDGVRIYRSRFPFWEAHRSMDKLQEGIANFVVDSAVESLLHGRPTISQQGLIALAGAILETAFMPRQLTEVSDVYYKVVYDRSYSQKHLGFIADEITKSAPGMKPYFAPSLEEYAKATTPWFTLNGPTNELKEFVKRAEQTNNGVKFDAILEWESIPNTEASRVRIYSLAASEQIKGKTPVAFEFLYPGDIVEKKKKKDDNQAPDLNHFRWFGQEAIPDYKPEGYFRMKSEKDTGEMTLDRKEVFHYALSYFFNDMRALQQ